MQTFQNKTKKDLKGDVTDYINGIKMVLVSILYQYYSPVKGMEYLGLLPKSYSYH